MIIRPTLACLLLGTLAPAESAKQLSANHPASRWEHAYPVGNGTMGAMSFGGFPEERIALNNDTIWSPPRRAELPPGCRTKDMAEAFALAVKGDYAGAQGMYCRAKDKGNGVATYQCLGALEITHLANDVPVATERSLDLMTGEAKSIVRLADGDVRQSLLASFPDQCVVVHLETTRPAGLHCRFALSRPAGITRSYAAGGDLGFEGAAGTRFVCRARLLPDADGTVTADGNTLVLKGGESATIIITSATNYNRSEPRQPRAGDWASEADTVLDKAAARPWTSLRERATADHRALMERCQLNLGRTDPKIAALSTPERMDLFRKGGTDPELIELFFQMGRHLLVSSSRPGSLPPNLQGLWEPGLAAAWNGDFHLNINVQMNMWPANVTGLTECNEPFFALLKLLHRHGREAAASLGCRGYAAGLASDAWGVADWVGGSPEWDSWILGGHWAQEHLMEYYRFTQDQRFLRDTAWPILKDGSLFLLDWLREDPASGQLISGPGCSPENAFRYQNADGKPVVAYISNGNTVDHAIAWETFSDTLECAKLLGIADDFTAQVVAALKRVPAPPIGADGRIMEWREPFEEVWKGHRHKSHLYGLHPGHQITREATPELYVAAENSLLVRMDPQNGDCAGGGHTGWNLAWSANLWARLHRGDKALEMINEQLRTQVNENLFNRCGGPFQIDGNLGTPAAIAEMLVQSHSGVIELLPALPKAWPDGSASGLRVRGGFTIDLAWQAGKVTRYRLTGPSSDPVKIRIGGVDKLVKPEPGQ